METNNLDLAKRLAYSSEETLDNCNIDEISILRLGIARMSTSI